MDVRYLDVKRYGIVCERLGEDLHACPEAGRQAERSLIVDGVCRKCTVILYLLARAT